MSIAELAPLFSGPDKWPRAYGLARSLVIYYGQPWRLPKLKRLYRPFLQPGELAFDIGAHVGNRTRVWAGLGARVVAVEPQADLAAFLRWKFDGRDDVTVVETALAASPGNGLDAYRPDQPDGDHAVQRLDRPGHPGRRLRSGRLEAADRRSRRPRWIA